MPENQNQFAFRDITDNDFASLLYTAVFNETQRLKFTYRSRQRQQIRNFILAGYKLYLQSRASSRKKEEETCRGKK